MSAVLQAIAGRAPGDVLLQDGERALTAAALPEGLLAYPTAVDGALGVKFIEAALASSQSGGAWVGCSLSS